MPEIFAELNPTSGPCVRFLNETTFRVCFTADKKFTDSALNRYEFITEPAAENLPQVTVTQNEAGFVAETSRVRVQFTHTTGRLEVTNRRTGKVVLEQIHTELAPARAHFRVAPDEDWIGFGDQTRERLFHRGQQINLWVSNVKSYVPVPFFMSTRGCGVLINSTHQIRLDMAHSQPDQYFWQDQRGVIDYYVFVGDSFKNLIEQYTDLTGKPKLPPLWSFGLWYLCRMQANDFEVMSDALNFRNLEIPCDIIGLEPGWMEVNYDYSTNKSWNSRLFPIPYWAPNGPHNFFNALKRMGFHLELWLCNDYDLSGEEERRIQGNTDQLQATGSAGNFQADAEIDTHFQYPVFQDQITKKGEAWFEHLKKFVDQGVDFFKQDGSLQVNDHPDRIFSNGMRDAEMHNLYPLLYSRQMHQGFETHTGRRALVFTVAGWAGFQAWCGTWTGDTGGRLITLGGMLNTALIGHSWATNDMEVAQKEGIHFGYLQPWSQINSWTYFRMPWVQGTELLKMHQDYSRLRARLIPYLYAWAYQATRSGVPLLRPLALEFESDLKSRNVLHEYLLGRDLLVVIYKNEAWFPAGLWKDFWTGEILPGGQEKPITWPENRGGGLYVRSGGIIPFGPLLQHRGEKPIDAITIYLFPDETETTLEFYEDDGISLAHHTGECGITPISCRKNGQRVQATVGKTRGHFSGQSAHRTWGFTVALDFTPGKITINQNTLPASAWKFDAVRNELHIDSQPGPIELEIE